MSTPTSMPTIPEISEGLIKKILEIARADWFTIDEIDPKEGTATLSTRHHGSVGDEEPGQEDIQAAKRIRITIREQFAQFTTRGDVIDEWVHIDIKPRPPQPPKPIEG